MARLPQPGGDNGNWGLILNEYLSQTLKSDGSIKENAVTNSAIAPDAITANEIADGSIQEAQLSADVQIKLNQTAPTWSSLTGKPAVIAAGSDQASARSAIGAGNVTGTGITNIVSLTQAAYNALTPNANTLYVITGP